ncbi:OLC1v1006451C1 [Oldenlandia corymbosa var. corymbosa]|uniref:OLC1v1006451C1 n=1 Tax=Oldenlandia corymbosa var. corymbosa TaxID=529605 RepID=A0AAV1DH24_OLDCO|nr:OLC1v1006451C1 [Oldenlandia corymbosa var. corymbosa]
MMSKICMNESCRLTTSSEWKNGWVLKSGGFATLCYSCGAAYEKFAFCDTFHRKEDGWRDCRICGKPMHCGCVASKLLIDCLDTGGVACASCVKSRDATPLQPVQILGDDIIANGTVNIDVVPTVGKRRNFGDLLQIGSSFDISGSRKVLKTQIYGNASSYLGQSRSEGTMLPFGEVNIGSPHFAQQPLGSSIYLTPESHRAEPGVKDMHESLVQSPLNMSLSNTLSASSSGIPFSDAHVEGSDQNKGSPSQRSRNVLPKPPKPVSSAGSDATRSPSQPRIARPPAEGRGRSQLLPRYWPRITEQELQQISGDLKSTIVPLFEKVLSASDAGRIGRLVLPKACAEAYFPPINQSEGLPIRIQDVKGKEWTFQFRFWPNNNSRMYVLEGVTPCIQNMQLQAGDTVTFSRIDPGGQLVMGFRKSTSNVDNQDQPSSGLPNGGSSGENSHSGASDNMLNGSHTGEDSLQQQTLISEKKKARNIGKNKRLLMHSDDALELRVTWEEAQELLRPPPTNNPTIIKIDDYEFEEYDEPPIFGKKTTFTVGPSGKQEQWVQCDNCSKWRKLPVDYLVPASWTCSDNIYDPNSSCSAPDEINPREEDALNKSRKGMSRFLI